MKTYLNVNILKCKMRSMKIHQRTIVRDGDIVTIRTRGRMDEENRFMFSLSAEIDNVDHFERVVPLFRAAMKEIEKVNNVTPSDVKICPDVLMSSWNTGAVISMMILVDTKGSPPKLPPRYNIY